MAPPLTCGPGAPKRRLLQAAADGDLQRFKRIASVLDAGKGRLGQTVAAVKDRGAGALHIAAFPGRTALCAYLVEELHQDVNAADESGETPLVYAIRDDTVDTVQYLLDHGANPDKPDANGSTPLHLAAAGGNCEIVKALLSKGADIHSFFGIGSTPLHMAAACKQYNAMKVLLDNHADCNKVTNSVYTPLMAALTAGSLECVKLLVKAGADVKGVGTITPLLFAVKKGLTDFYKCLLEAGADPNFRDDFGNLPIEIAANKDRRKDVAILFLVTSRVPYVHDWSIDGIISYVKSMPSLEDDPVYGMEPADMKLEGSKAYKRKDYVTAAKLFFMAARHFPDDATLLSNRSLCWLKLGEGDRALMDAQLCRMKRPGWAKACYLQGAAQMLLKVHFFLKRTVGSLSDAEIARLNSWALGLRVLSLLPLPSQQRCSSLHEHPQLIIEVLLMMKQFQSASLILKEFPALRDDRLIISYAKKAISINVSSTPRERRLSISASRAKQKKATTSVKTNFVQSFGNFQREARKAFSWVPRDSGTKTPPKDTPRKRKSLGSGGDRSSWDAMPGVQEERTPVYPSELQDRLPFVSAPDEWVLTGDPDKDDATRSSHRYETSPDITLFKALISLCTDESVAAKGALELCMTQMKVVLSSQQLPLDASMDNIARAYHATETYVQALSYAKNLFKKLVRSTDLSSGSERSKDVDDISVDTGSSSAGSQYIDELSDLLAQADMWLGRAELLQSLLGSGIIASLDDIADKESSTRLRDRLVSDERYSMAVYTCRKCKIDAFLVWVAWGHALVRMEHYAQARVKFKQALQQYKGDAATVVSEIINTIEGGPPVDVSSVRSMYEHLAKSAATIFDDSLSADAYLNVLYMPSTFPRSESSRQSRDPIDNQFTSASSYLEDGPRSNLDSVRYAECIHYLHEYARPQMLAFMFRHGRYAEACSLFFPFNQPTTEGETSLSSVPWSDPLTTDYGTIDDLCDLCLGYGAMAILENTIRAVTQSPAYHETPVIQYMNTVLTRICNYCETHRHFNYLYNFLVLKDDHVASGLCCIQLFMNSMSQEEALRHLGHAKTHFEEALSVRDRTMDATKLVLRSARNKSTPGKMTRETIMKYSTRVSYQMDVVKALNNIDGPQWKTSLFGNPTDPETMRRRCMVVETLAEKHFDLAFRMLHEFDLPAVDIYAGVAASLAERKKGGQLTEFLKNIRGTIDDDEWDQVLGAAINVYANKHKERPDRLIDMLISNHRKVLACVVCGRLKSAFQIASRSGSVADVQYVAHQALHANALPVLDMCKQWLAQYM